MITVANTLIQRYNIEDVCFARVPNSYAHQSLYYYHWFCHYLIYINGEIIHINGNVTF